MPRAPSDAQFSPPAHFTHTLLPPRALFVFSFYDAPNPDSFFAEVSAWLGGFHEPRSSRREEAHSSHSGSQSLLTSAATAEGNAAHVSYQQTLRLLSCVAAEWRAPPVAWRRYPEVLHSAPT